MRRTAIASYRQAEVRCMHCGTTVGVMRQRQDLPGAPALFKNHRDSSMMAIRSLTALRCAHCGGSVYTDDYDVYDVYPEDRVLDRPRRGRPPKWLVELRRAQEAEESETLESA